MKMMYSRMMPTEILGLDKLDLMGEMIFGASDPSEIYAKESPMRFETSGGVHELILKIPFAEKGEVELYKVKEDTVIIQVGSHRRNVSLPLTLTKSKLLGAEMRNGELVVKFEEGT
jgi:arsenite-transporting ATPase